MSLVAPCSRLLFLFACVFSILLRSILISISISTLASSAVLGGRVLGCHSSWAVLSLISILAGLTDLILSCDVRSRLMGWGACLTGARGKTFALLVLLDAGARLPFCLSYWMQGQDFRFACLTGCRGKAFALLVLLDAGARLSFFLYYWMQGQEFCFACLTGCRGKTSVLLVLLDAGARLPFCLSNWMQGQDFRFVFILSNRSLRK